jgi:hypothetical protein
MHQHAAASYSSNLVNSPELATSALRFAERPTSETINQLVLSFFPCFVHVVWILFVVNEAASRPSTFLLTKDGVSLGCFAMCRS